MADGIPDGHKSFGEFPEIASWSPDNHMLFDEETRKRLKTVVQGSLLIPDCPEGEVPYRHPECLFAKLPRSPRPSEDLLTKILEYVAGRTSPAHRYFKKSPSKAWYGVEETPLVITKPPKSRGLILEFRYRVDLWAMAGRALSIDLNGLPLRIKFGLSTNDVTWSFNHPEGVNGTGWDLFYDGQRPGFTTGPFPDSGDWDGRFAFEASVRLVVRPFGRSVFLFPTPFPGLAIGHPWVLEGVTEHGPCTGVTQGNQGAPVRLPCKVLHDAFDTEQFSLRFGYPENVDEAWLRDVNIMFF